MKKLIFNLLVMVLICIPINTNAKTILCSSGDTKVEIEKDQLTLDEKTFIAVNTKNDYDVSYNISNKDIIFIDDDGIVTPLKEGSTNVNVLVNILDSDTLQASSCTVLLSIKVLSKDSSLKALNIAENNIEFNKNSLEYSFTVPYKTEKLNINAIPNNENAKVTGAGLRYLNTGENEINIIVTAENNTTTTYKLHVTREEASKDNTLKSLVVEGFVISPKFSEDVYKYTLDVPKETDEVTINATPNDVNAKVEGNQKYILASGKNTYTITVVAEDGSSLQYEIDINKSKGTSKLESLTITNHKLNVPFQSDIYTYYLTIKNNIDKLDIKATSIDNDQVEIIGNRDLKVGENEILIRVVGSDKANTTYKIMVTKLSKEEEKLINQNNILLRVLLIMFIISILLMVGFISLFVKRNYQKDINKKFNKINNAKKKKKNTKKKGTGDK